MKSPVHAKTNCIVRTPLEPNQGKPNGICDKSPYQRYNQAAPLGYFQTGQSISAESMEFGVKVAAGRLGSCDKPQSPFSSGSIEFTCRIRIRKQMEPAHHCVRAPSPG
jgi:hypothetical protein